MSPKFNLAVAHHTYRLEPAVIKRTTLIMNAEQFRKAGHELIDFIADYMGSIEQQPVRNTNIQPNDIKKMLPRSPPQGIVPIRCSIDGFLRIRINVLETS